MKKKWLSLLFTFIMLCYVVFMVWYLPSRASLQFRLADEQMSLETSQGRERKQQHEYDEVVKKIPLVQASLDELLPQTETASQEVTDLKARRKELRKEKKDLEAQLAEMGKADSTNGVPEDNSDEE